MNIVVAKADQCEMVRMFYHSLIESMKDSPYDIGWKKDIYPSTEFLKGSIMARELYIGLEKDTVIAAMVLNHEYNDGYKSFDWHTRASAEEITVIHALGVHPAFGGRGYAKEMVKKALRIAMQNQQKAVRLDVLCGNVPAERLYTGIGFRYMGTLKMYYEDTGWTDYGLYEYVL